MESERCCGLGARSAIRTLTARMLLCGHGRLWEHHSRHKRAIKCILSRTSREDATLQWIAGEHRSQDAVNLRISVALLSRTPLTSLNWKAASTLGGNLGCSSAPIGPATSAQQAKHKPKANSGKEDKGTDKSSKKLAGKEQTKHKE